MNSYEKNVLQELVKSGNLREEQKENFEKNLNKSPLKFEDYITRKLKISSEELLKAKKKAANVPAWSSSSNKMPGEEVLKLVPREVAEQYEIVPLEKKDKKVIIGMTDPTDLNAQKAAHFLLIRKDLTLEVVAITQNDFSKVMDLYEGLQEEVESALEEIEDQIQEGGGEAADIELEEGGGELKEAPVTKIVAVILKHAVEGKASDIHIEPLREETKVRFRVDGVLYSSIILPASVHSSIVARVKILSSLRLDESRIPQDGRFATRLEGRLIDFRVSTFPTNLGEKVVMRVLDPSAVILEFQELGLVGPNRRKIEEVIKEPFGVILVSGPTGSGKTTTLYAALSRLDKQVNNVMSLEDPVEYYIDGISQSQIRPDIDYTFASGLRHMLRQDPDIMMVGEIRDSETAKLATQASLTGHLVFSTIHTNNAIGVIPRLLNLGVDHFLLPSSLEIAMAQRLVGRLCPHCKKESKAHPEMAKLIDDELSKLPGEILKEFDIKKPYTLWESEGCPKCNNKRTKGRTGIFEVLRMTDELKRIILEKESSSIKIEEEARRQGMISMKQDGIIKALQGVVSIEDVLRVMEEQVEV